MDVLGNMNVKSKLDVLGLGEFKENLIYMEMLIYQRILNVSKFALIKENMDVFGNINVKNDLIIDSNALIKNNVDVLDYVNIKRI